jgi:ketosteroid isomerase-like protein
LSVWRRQPSGQWRVLIDVGVGTPAVPPFEPGFHRFPMPDRYTGGNDAAAGTRDLGKAERALNDRLATGPLADGYAPALLESSRLHRNEIMPLVGRAVILDWMRSRPARFTGSSIKAQSAAAGDLGYSYGSYQIEGKDKAPETGHYIRVWQRRADGAWFVVVDVTRPRE